MGHDRAQPQRFRRLVHGVIQVLYAIHGAVCQPPAYLHMGAEDDALVPASEGSAGNVPREPHLVICHQQGEVRLEGTRYEAGYDLFQAVFSTAAVGQ